MASQIGIFDELREEAHGRELSIRWYRQKVQELLPKPQVRRMIREGFKTQKVTVRPNFGMMNLFYYRPKGAEKLPYYDVFPLVIPMHASLVDIHAPSGKPEAIPFAVAITSGSKFAHS